MDWDAPKATRGLFAAALVAAAAGLYARKIQPPRQLDHHVHKRPDAPRLTLKSNELPSAHPAFDEPRLVFHETNFAQFRDAIAAPGLVAGGVRPHPLRPTPGFAAAAFGAAAGRAGEVHGTPAKARQAPRRQTAPRAAASRQPAAVVSEPMEAAAGRRPPSAQATRVEVPPASTPRRTSDDSGLSSRRTQPQLLETERAAPPEASPRPAGASSRLPRAQPYTTVPQSVPAVAGHGAPRTRGRLSRVRPVLLGTLLGKKALKPPPASLEPPRDSPWRGFLPGAGYTHAQAEAFAPPDISCRRRGPPHAHEGEGFRWVHDKTEWSRVAGARQARFTRATGRWWLWPAPGEKPLVRHAEHWWMKSRGTWFLLHEGEPWGLRHFPEWGVEGFEDGRSTRIIYSRDGARVAVVVEGEGAAVYDAASGALLGRVAPQDLPKGLKPRVPDLLSLGR